MAKILVVGKYYPPFRGGTEIYTRDVCEALAVRHDVVAVVTNHEAGDKNEKIGNVTVVRCTPQIVLSGQPISLSMFRAIDLDGVDLVHFHAPNFFANLVLLQKMLTRARPVPVVITHHMDVYGRKALKTMVMPLYRMLVERSKAVIVSSRKNAALSVDLPKCAPVVEIPLGIDIERFSKGAEFRAEAAAWRKHRIGDARSVGFVGRHARYKGIDVLLKAVAGLENTHALIAGDGPYRRDAEILARDLGIVSRIHFLGTVSEAEKDLLLAASDVFVLPSTEITEAFGVSQLEAMAMDVPVVASNLPTGVTDIAIDRKTALLCRPGDPDDLRMRLAEILGNKALADQLIQNAKAHVQAKFANSHVLAQVCDVVDSCLDGRVIVTKRTSGNEVMGL